MHITGCNGWRSAPPLNRSVRDEREESNKNKGTTHGHWGKIINIYTIICIVEGIVLMVGDPYVYVSA